MKALQFFNTLSGNKDSFTPLSDKKIKMYCCGITPYSNVHLGHSRTFFSYDLLYRTLQDHGFNVESARNITDVEDKIINRALKENISCAELVDRYVVEQNKAMADFDLNEPQHEPKVTDNIPNIIDIIQTLIEKNYAYASTSGVYFRVRRFSEYGKLSGNKIDELKQGARIEIDESKEDALDFVLWKFAKPNEIFWESPWGKGRPGWHIECSAMIHSLFGDSIDIHMGGRDLIFPHHEAEIAQSEAATGKRLANYWLHAGMVTLYGEKMSKSTNHFVSIKDFLEKYPPEVLRLVFLSTSYSQPLDFTFELASENFKKLSKIYRFVALIDSYAKDKNLDSKNKSENSEEIFDSLVSTMDSMKSSLADDLNSSSALAVFFEFIRSVNKFLSKMEKENKFLSRNDIKHLENSWPEFKSWVKKSLGLLKYSPKEFFEIVKNYASSSEISEQQIDDKIKERHSAREHKDWTKSDLIRDELLKYGVQIQDTPSGTKWTVLL